MEHALVEADSLAAVLVDSREGFIWQWFPSKACSEHFRSTAPQSSPTALPRSSLALQLLHANMVSQSTLGGVQPFMVASRHLTIFSEKQQRNLKQTTLMTEFQIEVPAAAECCCWGFVGGRGLLWAGDCCWALGKDVPKEREAPPAPVRRWEPFVVEALLRRCFWPQKAVWCLVMLSVVPLYR